MRELVTLAVLAARQLHACPHAVLLAVRDGVLGAAALLRQWAAPQALQARLGGRPFVCARLRRAVTTVVVGVAKPKLRVGCARMSHVGLLVERET